MAKYVMLSFDKDSDADAFVAAAQSETGILWTAYQDQYDDRAGGLPHLEAIVRAVFKKPTLTCACVKSPKQGRAFTRGKKYGWWVCKLCGKPTPGWVRGEHWFLALGRNLLPINQEAPEYRGDGVFQTHAAQTKCDKCNTPLRGEVGHVSTKVWCPTCEENR